MLPGNSILKNYLRLLVLWKSQPESPHAAHRTRRMRRPKVGSLCSDSERGGRLHTALLLEASHSRRKQIKIGAEETLTKRRTLCKKSPRSCGSTTRPKRLRIS